MLVYKYRGGDEQTFLRDIESLENNMYYASSSDELNDPCETLIDSEKFIGQAKSLSKYLGFGNKESLSLIDKSYRDVLSFDKKMGIYSLSQTHLDELLWAHYGNSHKGFCIEYDLELLIKSYKLDKIYSFPVSYNDKVPNIGLIDVALNNPDDIIRKMGGFKSNRWAYEKEFRIITNKFGLQSYNFEAVKSIFFGLRMSDSHKIELMNRLKGRGINYFQVEQVPVSYNFNTKPIEDINRSEVTYLNQIPSSITNSQPIKFRIIEKDYTWFNGKATINIELNSLINEKELNWIGNTIRKNIFQQAERIFMFFYIKNQKDRSIAWATTHFQDDELVVSINEFVEI